MGFAVYNDSSQLTAFILLIVFTPLGIFVTGLRFIATRRGARKLSYEDWLAVVATLFFIGLNVAGVIGKYKFIYDLPLGFANPPFFF
jgi:threonine/homoserine/homoserine lactone efflux protein